MATVEVLSKFSSSDGTKTYEIRRGKDNAVYCTCPAWRFAHKTPKTCKHLKAYRAARAVPEWLDPNRS